MNVNVIIDARVNDILNVNVNVNVHANTNVETNSDIIYHASCVFTPLLTGSISKRNFQNLKNVLRKAIDQFDISETGTHVALIEYSTEATVQLKFNELSGAQINAPNVKRKIQAIPHSRGFTYINKALNLADKELFTEANGMRKDVLKVRLTFCQRYIFVIYLTQSNSVKEDLRDETSARFLGTKMDYLFSSYTSRLCYSVSRTLHRIVCQNVLSISNLLLMGCVVILFGYNGN